jgi:hypothetical protein
MPIKPIELPPKVAKAFIADMRTFFAEKNAIRADGIAARQGRRHAQLCPKRTKDWLAIASTHRDCALMIASKTGSLARHLVAPHGL